MSSFKPNPPQEKRLGSKGEGVELFDEKIRDSERLRQRGENYEEEDEREGRGREEGRKRNQDGVKKLSPSEAVTISPIPIIRQSKQKNF